MKLFADAAALLASDGAGQVYHPHASCVDVLCLQTSTVQREEMERSPPAFLFSLNVSAMKEKNQQKQPINVTRTPQKEIYNCWNPNKRKINPRQMGRAKKLQNV